MNFLERVYTSRLNCAWKKKIYICQKRNTHFNSANYTKNYLKDYTKKFREGDIRECTKDYTKNYNYIRNFKQFTTLSPSLFFSFPCSLSPLSFVSTLSFVSSVSSVSSYASSYVRSFSASTNTEYQNYINEIDHFINLFQNCEEKDSSDNNNIITILQKIKKDKKYEDNENLMDIISSTKLLIEKRVRPIIVNDGGDIKFVCFDVDDGIVYVQLDGACVNCSQSEMTLQFMIKNMLTYYISEIKEIKNVSKSGIIL